VRPTPDEQKELGRLLGYSQIGFEFVGPMAVGAILDYYVRWTPAPWGTVVGAVLGFVVGLYHLVQLLGKDDRPGPPPSPQGPP